MTSLKFRWLIQWRNLADWLFVWGSLAVAAVWSLQAVADVALTRNPFAVTHLLPFSLLQWGVCLHSATLLLLAVVYAVCLRRLAWLHGAIRVAAAATLVAVAVNLNGFLWTLGDDLVNGTGAPVATLVPLCLSALLLQVLHVVYGVVRARWPLFIVASVATAVTYLVFLRSGFYEAWFLFSKVGGHPDPHNWLWLLRGATGLLVPVTLAADSPNKKSIYTEAYIMR